MTVPEHRLALVVQMTMSPLHACTINQKKVSFTKTFKQKINNKRNENACVRNMCVCFALLKVSVYISVTV